MFHIDYCEEECRYGWQGICHNQYANVYLTVMTGRCKYKKPKEEGQNKLFDDFVMEGENVCD